MTARSLRSRFKFEQHKTNASREIIAGLTTFTTMA
jgi:xanthine/uracil/vitamin C permease (AzgA family)